MPCILGTLVHMQIILHVSLPCLVKNLRYSLSQKTIIGYYFRELRTHNMQDKYSKACFNSVLQFMVKCRVWCNLTTGIASWIYIRTAWYPILYTWGSALIDVSAWPTSNLRPYHSQQYCTEGCHGIVPSLCLRWQLITQFLINWWFFI